MQTALWQRVSYPAGSRIFSEGETGEVAYLVENGSVGITQERPDGSPVLLKTVQEGEIFGEIALVDHLPRTASASAIQDTVLIAISSQFFYSKLKNADPLLGHMLALVVSRFRQGNSSTSLNATTVHLAALHDYAVTHIKASQDLSEGIERQEFSVFFQPVVHLQDRTLAGFEALLRWNRPGKGLISPGEFIGLAETTGLILPLGRWMTEEALRVLQIFNSMSCPPGKTALFMSINLSARQLLEPGELDAMIAIVQNSGIPPAQIKFEITESMMMENMDEAIRAMHRLKETGVLLAIDDFGTGYSSLSYLERMPLDNLKIDRSFVIAMRSKDSGHRIASAIAAMAHGLGMDCIAEGIEDSNDERALKALGCKYGQGYLFGKPMAFEDALSYLQNQPQGC